MILEDGASGSYNPDMILDFYVADASADSNTTTNDRLNLPSNTIAAPTGGVINGDNFGALMSHSIAGGGIISFGSTDVGGSAVPINALNLTDAMNYLRTNFTGVGQTVAFAYDSDSDGSTDSTVVFQNIDAWDIAAELIGVTGVILGTSPGQNVVQLVDTTGPEPIDASFTSAAMIVTFWENVFATSTAGLAIQRNGSGGDIVSTAGIVNNVMTINTSVSDLDQAEFLLVTYDSGPGVVQDASGNEMASLAAAIGGSGNNTIDMSVFGNGLYIAGFAGNDAITGSIYDDEIEGGLGADNLNGGGGADSFYFEQGDSPLVTFTDLGAIGLDTGDTFVFAGGVAELISGGFTVTGQNGDRIELNTTQDNAQSLTPIAAPSSGLVTDQSYFLVRGNLSGGTFTVDTGAGGSTLVVYDGDSSAAVSQTALVLSGVSPSLLTTNYSSIYLTA